MADKPAALGTDPFAALGLTPATPSGEDPNNERQRPPARHARAQGRTTTQRQRSSKKRSASQKRAEPRARRRPESASARVSRPDATHDLAQIEARLEEAFRRLETLPLPELPERTIRDEFFELLRGILRLTSPLYYYRLYHEYLLGTRSLDVDPFGLDPVFEERAERLASFLYHKWWRVDAQGLEHIPAGGRALLVANHSGMLPYDGAMIKHAVRVEHPARRTVRFLVENFAFYFPFLGTLVYRYGGVRASMDNALRLLRDDQLTAVFPEGVKGLGKYYRQRYQLQRFGRGGFIKLALRARSPIVPVAVIGAEEIHPIVYRADFLAKLLNVPYFPVTPTFPWLGPLGLIPLPTKWTIRFGEPLLFPLEYGPEEADNEILVNELTLKVRRIIHEMIYETLAQRRSIFFG